MKPSDFDSGVVASLLVMTAGDRCSSMEAVCLDCYRVMLSDGRGGDDEDGCVADACRESGPMKRRFLLRRFFIRFSSTDAILYLQYSRWRWVSSAKMAEMLILRFGCGSIQGSAAGSFLRRLDPDLFRRRRVSRAVGGVNTWVIT
ncbi:Uncharacterized protein Rs2_18198 [Raphanus sativus]|nr:Uncharacterized protein Rs2_18198 [Raphanus sativus]